MFRIPARCRLALCCMLLLFLLVPSAFSQDSLFVELLYERHDAIDQVWDFQLDMFYAHLACGKDGYRVYDFFDPTSPNELSTTYFSAPDHIDCNFADKVRVDQMTGRAFVLWYDGSMEYDLYTMAVYDVSNPSAPSLLGVMDLPDSVNQIIVEGNYAYVAAASPPPGEDDYGLQVIDVSDPANMSTVAFFPTGSPLLDLHIAGASLCLTTYTVTDSLYLLSLADPTAPTLQGSWAPQAEARRLQQMKDDGSGHLFLLDWFYGLRVLDISNPASISEVGSLEMNAGGLYTPYYAMHYGMNQLRFTCWVFGDITQAGLISVADPTSPELVGTWEGQGLGSVYASCIDYSSVYIWNSYIGSGCTMRMVDLTDPDNADVVTTWQPESSPEKFAKSGNFGYGMLRDGRIRIDDMSDPANPQFESYLVPATDDYLQAICTTDDYLITSRFSGGSIDSVGIVIYSLINDPTVPEYGWFFQTAYLNEPPLDFAVDGTSFAAVEGTSGVSVYSLPNNEYPPLRIANWNVPDENRNLSQVALDWPTLYAVDVNHSEVVIFGGTWEGLEIITTIATDGVPWDVALSEDRTRLFIADGASGLSIYDVSDPSSPTWLSSCSDDLDFAVNVQVQGNLAAVLNIGDTGLHVFWCSDPTQPEHIAYHSTQGMYPLDLLLENNTIYVVEENQFEIYELDENDVHDATSVQPCSFTLDAPWPNPFNAQVKIGYTLEQAGQVSLKLYDVLGRQVRTLVQGNVSQGHHELFLSCDHLAAGTYFLAIEKGSQRIVKQVTLLK